MNERKTAVEKSPVPMFEFTEKLEEQEAQLAANPLLKRFADSRMGQAADPYHPAYHFVNPEGEMNDANGLCFWQGRWHLFYQAMPPETRRAHWGHAVSTDLTRWRDLPYAIAPDVEKDCYSGSTLVEKDRAIAMYHGTMAGNMVAAARDPLLLNWNKLTGAPVIPMYTSGDQEQARRKGPDGSPLPYRIHDPFLWRKGEFYYSLSAGTLPGNGGKQFRANFLFRSADLVTWEYLHPFVEGDRFTLIGDDGACPYFWPLGNRHILIFFSHQSGAQYLLGDYDTEHDKFVATSHGRFNFNSPSPAALQSPSVTPDGKDSLIAIFNMNATRVGWPQTEGFSQVMSLPRRLTLSGSDDLRMIPAGDIESLRGEHRSLPAMKLPANKEIVLEGITGNALEITAVLVPGETSMIEMCVLRSPAKEEYTRIMFYPGRGLYHQSRFGQNDIQDGLISIDSSLSSTVVGVKCRAPETAPVSINGEEDLNLRVFVDHSVVEVFVNERQCVAIRVFPGRKDSIGVSLRSQGGDAQLKSLNVWEMKSIYKG